MTKINFETMNEIINFNYEGNEIPFRIDENGEIFMDATEMAKPFSGKRVNNFLRNKNTVEYINALHEEKGVARISVATDSQLVIAKMGGDERGSWFQRNLALEFARWLNPKFNVWCNNRIDEIFNKGFTALTPEGTDYIDKEVDIETEMLNDIGKHIREGRSKSGKLLKDFMIVDISPG